MLNDDATNRFTYEINGRKYYQTPLVLGQWRQLLKIKENLNIPESADDLLVLADIVGDKFPFALAVVLTPEGVAVKDKDLPAIADELEFTIEPETIIQVIEDFFKLNPISLIMDKLGQTATTLSGSLGKVLLGPEDHKADVKEENVNG